MVRQRENVKTPVKDMIEETEGVGRKLLDGSDSTRARLSRGEIVKGALVPTFPANTMRGPRSSTTHAIETVT